MAFDFPASPAEGAVYTQGDYSYTFQNGVWMPTTTVMSPVPLRNRIVNPCMLISQEFGDVGVVSSSANFAHVADQWIAAWNLPGTVQAQRGRPVPITGSDHLNAWVGTASPSPAAGSYWQLLQYVEGNRVKDFQWGTASAKRAILRFNAWSNVTATLAVTIRNAVADRSYLAPFTVQAGQWSTVQLVIPGDITGVWPKDNNGSVLVGIGLASGTDYKGVAGWQAGNKTQITGNTNFAGAANNSFAFSDVGFYLDADGTGVPPRMELSNIDTDLLECLRYYEKGETSLLGYSSAGSGISIQVPFKTLKRAAPVMTILGWGATSNASGQVMVDITNYSCRFQLTTAATGAVYMLNVSFTASARMGV